MRYRRRNPRYKSRVNACSERHAAPLATGTTQNRKIGREKRERNTEEKRDAVVAFIRNPSDSLGPPPPSAELEQSTERRKGKVEGQERGRDRDGERGRDGAREREGERKLEKDTTAKE